MGANRANAEPSPPPRGMLAAPVQGRYMNAVAWHLRCETEEEALGWAAMLSARDPSAHVVEDAQGFAVECDDDAHARSVYGALASRVARHVDKEERQEIVRLRRRSTVTLATLGVAVVLFCCVLLVVYRN